MFNWEVFLNGLEGTSFKDVQQLIKVLEDEGFKVAETGSTIDVDITDTVSARLYLMSDANSVYVDDYAVNE